MRKYLRVGVWLKLNCGMWDLLVQKSEVGRKEWNRNETSDKCMKFYWAPDRYVFTGEDNYLQARKKRIRMISS